MEKIERGVMVMKDGKAWGITYKTGRETEYGWLNPADEKAMIYNPDNCKDPTYAGAHGSYYDKELLTAKLVTVERKTTVSVLD